jgi:integrase
MEPLDDSLTSIPPSLPNFHEMPTTLTALNGQSYDVAGDIWLLPEDPGFAAKVKFDWTLLTRIVIPDTSSPLMSPRAVCLAKLYVLTRMIAVKNVLKPRSGKGILRAVLHFASWLATRPEWLPIGRSFDWGDLTADMFDAWLTDEYRTKRRGNSALLLRGFYSWGADHDAGWPDFSPDLASMLRIMRIKKNMIGELVESRDVRRGPFNREELEIIFKACVNGAGEDQDRALAWTLLETGMRSKQLYVLTNRDLELVHHAAAEEGSGSTLPPQAGYRLRVRKLKCNNGTTSYHFLPLSNGCARLLSDLRRAGSGPDDRLLWWIPAFYAAYILKRLRSFFDQADLRSPRLHVRKSMAGEPMYERMPVSPRRFRYAVATDRIARGCTPGDVAAMLGHKDNETVHAYVETSPGIADSFQRATDHVIKPLIDLMEGRVKSSEVKMLAVAASPINPKPRPHSDVPAFGKGAAVQHHIRVINQNLKTDRSIRTATGFRNSEARIKELLARARRKFPTIYPKQNFEGHIWDVTHLRERMNVNSIVRFGFTTLISTRANQSKFSLQPEHALPAYFAEVVKSWLVISNHVTLSCNALRLYAARHFWNYLSTCQSRDATSFRWRDLTEGGLLGFEQNLLTYRTSKNKRLSPGTVLLIIDQVQRLVDFLAEQGICRRIDYVPQTPSSRASVTRRLEEKKLRAERKLPTSGVLESLGSIYHRLTTAPAGEVNEWVLVVISAIAILMLTGLRIGELVTLPYDCEVEDESPYGRPGTKSYRYGIRYWVEKAGKKMMRIKWISPTAETIVRSCVARIKKLTAAARERAKVLEADPSKVILPPDIASRDILSRPELLAVIGQRGGAAVRGKTGRQKLLPRHGKGEESYYYVKDLEAYLLSSRVPNLYTVRHDDGTVQLLSESLFILFDKQARARRIAPCLLLVKPITAHAIASYMARPDGVFKTYGEAEWERELSANPHCFRHWLIHAAYKGGMETHLVLRYFAKRFAAGIADYLHFTTDECNAYAPEELSAEEFYAPV